MIHLVFFNIASRTMAIVAKRICDNLTHVWFGSRVFHFVVTFDDRWYRNMCISTSQPQPPRHPIDLWTYPLPPISLLCIYLATLASLTNEKHKTKPLTHARQFVHTLVYLLARTQPPSPVEGFSPTFAIHILFRRYSQVLCVKLFRWMLSKFIFNVGGSTKVMDARESNHAKPHPHYVYVSVV